MHAVGHALVALAAGAVLAALAARLGGSGPRLGGLTRWNHAEGMAGDQAFFWSLVGLGVVFVKGITGVYASHVQGRVAGQVGACLRLELLDALLAVHRLRRPRHCDQGAACASAMAQDVAALTERVHEVEIGLKQGLLGGARAAAQLVPLAGVLVALSPRTAAVAALALATFGALLGRLRSGYRRAAARAGHERTRLLEAADESVRHAELWVSYGAEGKARSALKTLGEAIACGGARLDARAAALSGANEVLGAAALAAAIGASRADWLGPAADGETLLAFAVAFFLAYRPIRELAEARLVLARAADAYEELGRLIHFAKDTKSARFAAGPWKADLESSDPGKACRTEARTWPLAPLELRELRLARGGCGPVSLRIEPGSIVVIRGRTGAGKTTLLRTLLGFEPAAGGQLLFDGIPIGDAPAGPASRPFAWMPQDAPLLADTLDANISLGVDLSAREVPREPSGADLAAVAAPVPSDLDHAAVRAAGGSSGSPLEPNVWSALDPIGATHLTRLVGRARLGAGGRAVSGGERQWIALARAIATAQPVLLLDEPTSGLDAEAQRRVLDAIASLRGRRTVLLVTHRPEPVGVADVVLRLDDSGALLDAA